jgi:hypothetical protein
MNKLRVGCGKARASRGSKRMAIARTALGEIERESALEDVLDLHGLLHPLVPIEGIREFAKARRGVKLKDAFGAPFRELEHVFAARLHDVLTGCGTVYAKDGVVFAISDQLEFLDRAAGGQRERARLCAVYGGKLGVNDRLCLHLNGALGCPWLANEAADVAEIFGVDGEVELGRSIKVYAYEQLAEMARRKFWVTVSVGGATHDFVKALFEGASRRSFDRAWICDALSDAEESLGLGDYGEAADLIVAHAEHAFRHACLVDEAAVAYAAISGGGEGW